MATGSFVNVSWRQQDGHAGPLLSPQCPPLTTVLGTETWGAYLGVKFHLGSQQFEVDAAELTIALTQVALWGPKTTVEIQGRLWKSFFYCRMIDLSLLSPKSQPNPPRWHLDAGWLY